MRLVVGVGMCLSGLALCLVFRTPRGLGLALWLILGSAALLHPRLRCRRRLGLGAVVGLLALLGAAPPSGPSGPAWLRLSPFNLAGEPDWVRLGLRLFYPGAAGERVEQLAMPYYQTGPEQATPVHFTFTDLFGLGNGSGHLYCSTPDGEGPYPTVLFLHGALGNFRSYLNFWQGFRDGHWAVLCPTFGFGNWYRPGGRETVAAALDFGVAHLGVDPDRVVLAGMSNGATGAVRAIAAYPERFGALVLVSPVLEPERVTDPAFVAWARTHPVIVIEGDADVNVTPAQVERGVRAMQSEEIPVRYHLLPGHDHFLLFSARDQVFRILDRELLDTDQ